MVFFIVGLFIVLIMFIVIIDIVEIFGGLIVFFLVIRIVVGMGYVNYFFNIFIYVGCSGEYKWVFVKILLKFKSYFINNLC